MTFSYMKLVRMESLLMCRSASPCGSSGKYPQKFLRIDASGHRGCWPDRFGPNPVRGVPAETAFLQLVDDLLAWLVLGTPFTEFEGHLAVALALEEMHAGQVIASDAERIGSGNPLLSYLVGKAGLNVVRALVFRLNSCSRFGGGDRYVSSWFLIDRFAFARHNILHDVQGQILNPYEGILTHLHGSAQ
jgi:hypothetical protein